MGDVQEAGLIGTESGASTTSARWGVDSSDWENKQSATSTQTGRLLGQLDQANICFHLQLALETRVRRLKKPHHDIDNGVRFFVYALLVAGGQRMRVTPQVLITHN